MLIIQTGLFRCLVDFTFLAGGRSRLRFSALAVNLLAHSAGFDSFPLPHFPHAFALLFMFHVFLAAFN